MDTKTKLRYEERIRTRTMQDILHPLIQSVVSIENGPNPEARTDLDPNQAFQNAESSLVTLLKTGTSVLNAHQASLTPESIRDIQEALSLVQREGHGFLQISEVFVSNTSNNEARHQAAAQGLNLLEAVIELLFAADNVEVKKIKDIVDVVRRTLATAEQAPTHEVFLQSTSRLDVDIQELTELTRRRLKDCKSQTERDNLQSAIALLRKSVPLAYSSAQALYANPNSAEAMKNKNWVFEQMKDALSGIDNSLEGKLPKGDQREQLKNSGHVYMGLHSKLDPLISALETFKMSVYMEPRQYKPDHRRKLEELLERIAVMSANVADEDRTRPKRRNDIVQGVNNLRQALQDLLSEYERNIGKSEPSEDLDMATVHLDHKLKDLRRHLRRAIVDHVSDTFSTLDTPLKMLVTSALDGRREDTIEAAEVFRSHSEHMAEVADLVSKMSPDSEGVGMLKYSATLLRQLTPQVINAAILVSLKPNRTPEDPAVKNLHEFKELWEDRARALKAAMDSLISMDDMLAVTEQHILEDCNNGFQAIISANDDYLDRVAGTIRGRCVRVLEAVDSAIEDLPVSTYRENLGRATTVLRNVIPDFDNRASDIVNNVAQLNPDDEDEKQKQTDEFLASCETIHGAICNVRHALLMNRSPEDVDSDNEYEDDVATTAQGDQRSQVSDNEVDNQRRIMRELPDDDKREIQKHVSMFKLVHRKFEYEMGRWKEDGNELIALARKMGNIVQEMCEFTKGRGPFRTTMDVIQAALEVSDTGAKLNRVATSIAEDSVESSTRKDLRAYMTNTELFCHQLNITSKVKAEVSVVENEVKGVVNLEAVTSLIQTAKNLLNSVLQTVKLAYIASTKHRKKGAPPAVEWMEVTGADRPYLPEPVPLRNGAAVVRRRSDRRSLAPIREMANIHVH